MTCKEFEELSGAYALGAVTTEEHEEAQAHLAIPLTLTPKGESPLFPLKGGKPVKKSKRMRQDAQQRVINELLEGSNVLRQVADTLASAIPSTNTAYIQQAHLAVLHLLCELVEEHLAGL